MEKEGIIVSRDLLEKAIQYIAENEVSNNPHRDAGWLQRQGLMPDIYNELQSELHGKQ